MKEIVTIHVGQCGNKIGSQFWELLAYEHGLNPNGFFEGRSDLQLQMINVYFIDKSDDRFIPRAVLVDMEPSTIDSIVLCSHRNLFDSELIVCGDESSGNNWAKGHLTNGVEFVDEVVEIVRKLIENCERLQGFQIIHSLGGGTGSGLGSLLTNKLKECYSGKIICNFTIFPSTKLSEIVVEPYNATLAVQQLIENSDMTFTLDNEALYDICRNKLRVPEPTYGDINQLVCSCMSGVTCSLRFPGQLNADLRKLSVNMIPFPMLHFLVNSYAPLNPQNSSDNVRNTVPSLIHQLFHPTNLMASCDIFRGKYLATAAVFRGIISTKEVEEEMIYMQQKLKHNFVEWLPSNISTVICDIAPPGCDMCATFIGNTTAIKDVFERLSFKFSSLLDQKAFLHWYTDEGLEEKEFGDALSKMHELHKEYKSWETNSN